MSSRYTSVFRETVPTQCNTFVMVSLYFDNIYMQTVSSDISVESENMPAFLRCSRITLQKAEQSYDTTNMLRITYACCY